MPDNDVYLSEEFENIDGSVLSNPVDVRKIDRVALSGVGEGEFVFRILGRKGFWTTKWETIMEAPEKGPFKATKDMDLIGISAPNGEDVSGYCSVRARFIGKGPRFKITWSLIDGKRRL
jgi:hypothetical protein